MCLCVCVCVVFDESGNFVLYASMVGIKGQSVLQLSTCPVTMSLSTTCVSMSSSSMTDFSGEPGDQQVREDHRQGQSHPFLLSHASPQYFSYFFLTVVLAVW